MRNRLIELLKKASINAANHCADTDCIECCEAAEACFKGLEADYLIANGMTIQRWIPVGERLPEPEQDVLVSCKQGAFKYQCTAFYIPAKWEREKSNISWDWECCEDYDEEIDDYYVKSGWYEHIHNWDEYAAVGIADKVTHWMPLPEPSKED